MFILQIETKNCVEEAQQILLSLLKTSSLKFLYFSDINTRYFLVKE